MSLRSFRTIARLTAIAALFLCASLLSADIGARKLGLTPDQKAKVKALNEKSLENAKALQAQLEADSKHLKGLVKDQSADPVINAATLDVVADCRRIMDAEMAQQVSLQAILTPTQYAKVLVDRVEHRDGKRTGVGLSLGLGFGLGGGMGMGLGMGIGE